jgi:hypothetical protein
MQTNCDVIKSAGHWQGAHMPPIDGKAPEFSYLAGRNAAAMLNKN